MRESLKKQEKWCLLNDFKTKNNTAMRRQKIFLSLVLFLFAANVFAQSGWQWQNPLPTGNDLYKVKFIDVNTGFAVGENSTIIKTTNGGINWTYNKIEKSGVRLMHICAIDQNTIYIFSSGKDAFKTTNGGNNWATLPNVSEINWLNDDNPVCFVNANTGFVTGVNAIVYKTTNGGLNWNLNYNPLNFAYSTQIYFQSEQKGFFAYQGDISGVYGSILEITTNQGLTWTPCFHKDSAAKLSNFSFINSLTGYAFYKTNFDVNTIKTTNGGMNWNKTSKFETNYFYHKMNFVNNGTGYLTEVETVPGNQNLNTYKTTNDGVNWNIISNYGRAVNFNFADSGFGYAVGFGGAMYRITNSGMNWTYNTSPFGNLLSLNKVFFVNNTLGFILGQKGEFLKTTNAGINWNLSNLSSGSLSSIFYLNNENIFLGGANGKLFRTTNSGNSWDTIIVSPNYLSDVSSIYFFNTNTGIVTNTYYPYVFRTTNGGLNWTSFYLSGNGSGGLNFLNASTGYLFSYQNYLCPSCPNPYSKVFKTIDGGVNWNEIFYFQHNNGVKGLKFVTVDTGYMNISGTISKTVNGGLNWYNVLLHCDGNEIKVLSSNILYCGSYKTMNGGINWSFFNTKIQSINSIHFIDNNTGILVGGNGAGILRTTDGGEIISSVYSTQISSNIPQQFLLHQNYPNPFNPSTIINYQLTISSDVTLKVFDLLGKEVAQLVNEKQNAGSYAVDFNSTEFNLPSGIYFYTLNAGEFKETRKMVLIK